MSEMKKKDLGLTNQSQNNIIKEKKPKKNTVFKLMWIAIILFLILSYSSFYFGWVSFTVENSTVLIVMIFSILINISLLIIAFALPIGKKIILRFRQKLSFKTGKYVNSIFITKNGVVKELYIKKNDSGTVKINKKNYTRNPTLLFNFEGIPTYFYVEDHADPLNVWNEDFKAQISCQELDEVMNGSGAFDFKQWLEQNKMIIIIALGIVVVSALISVYLAGMNYQMLRDGTYAIAKGAKTLSSGI